MKDFPIFFPTDLRLISSINIARGHLEKMLIIEDADRSADTLLVHRKLAMFRQMSHNRSGRKA